MDILYFHKKCFRLLFLYLISVSVIYAQEPQNVTGTFFSRPDKNEQHFQIVNNLNSHKKLFNPMKAEMLNILSVLKQTKAVNPPIGFDIDSFISIYNNSNNNSKTGPVKALIQLSCFNYYKVQYSHKIKKSEESHANLNLTANDITPLCGKTFKQDCADTKTERFFFAFPIDRTNPVYFKIKRYRVIKRSRTPLFIPLTKKEYLKFLVKKEKLIKKACRENINDLNELKNLKSPEIGKSISQNKKAIEKIDNLINQYNLQLASMTKAEQNLRAYVEDYLTDNKLSGDQVNYEYPYQLVSKGNAKGKALWKINPDYINTSLPMTKVQVLIIDEHASNFCPPFLKQRLDSWFNQIDYKKLNELVSK